MSFRLGVNPILALRSKEIDVDRVFRADKLMWIGPLMFHQSAKQLTQ
jgi:hypothetical protein